MSSSLFINPNTWNLAVDSNRNIAVCADPYALAQNVSNAVRVFKGECYFSVEYGIDYLGDILGYTPPLSLIKARYEELAKTVKGVADARCTITGLTKERVCNGYITITTVEGGSLDISL